MSLDKDKLLVKFQEKLISLKSKCKIHKIYFVEKGN